MGKVGRPRKIKLTAEQEEAMRNLIQKCEEKRMSWQMLKEYHRSNKLKKCRKIIDKIDTAVISMEIKDDLDQTLESLAVRLGAMYQYDFDDLIRYLTENKDKLFYNRQVPGMVLKYDRIKWAPGTNSDAYDLFMML